MQAQVRAHDVGACAQTTRRGVGQRRRRTAGGEAAIERLHIEDERLIAVAFDDAGITGAGLQTRDTTELPGVVVGLLEAGGRRDHRRRTAVGTVEADIDQGIAGQKRHAGGCRREGGDGIGQQRAGDVTGEGHEVQAGWVRPRDGRLVGGELRDGIEAAPARRQHRVISQIAAFRDHTGTAVRRVGEEGRDAALGAEARAAGGVAVVAAGLVQRGRVADGLQRHVAARDQIDAGTFRHVAAADTGQIQLGVPGAADVACGVDAPLPSCDEERAANHVLASTHREVAPALYIDLADVVGIAVRPAGRRQRGGQIADAAAGRDVDVPAGQRAHALLEARPVGPPVGGL